MKHSYLPILIFLLIGKSPNTFGSESSYRVFHPLGWMHSLPVGEKPGWSTDSWFQFEVSQGNVWNLPISLVHKDTSDTFQYKADFGQTSYIMEVGAALSDQFALSLEVPYSSRNGGLFDHAIDEFHILIRNERFFREETPNNLAQFYLKTNGEDQINPEVQTGVGNIKFKMKYWPFKWEGRSKGICPCGASVSAQIKVPVAKPISGLTSAELDFSFLAHIGAPLFDKSAVWITSATTHIAENSTLEKWPIRTWQQMYEISFDFHLSGPWSFTFQTRAESPYLDRNSLLITDVSTDKELQEVASSWNSLVHWRGSEAFGFRYLLQGGSYFNFLLIEDFAPGQFDKSSTEEAYYVNNAPDIMLLIQSYVAF